MIFPVSSSHLHPVCDPRRAVCSALSVSTPCHVTIEASSLPENHRKDMAGEGKQKQANDLQELFWPIGAAAGQTTTSDVHPSSPTTSPDQVWLSPIPSVARNCLQMSSDTHYCRRQYRHFSANRSHLRPPRRHGSHHHRSFPTSPVVPPC